ncbi:glycosyltransferase [Occallatibacter savannae]|uniref:glycosyltransferase n=1 Tax=Occallatibacter savannae TaxID=1002691 RepID=UPI000D695138|nr:glycosyltransferase [Occallatibacter savannae]
MRLLRVIHSSSLETGGPVEGLLRTSEYLLRAGHEVELVCLEAREAVVLRDYPFPVIGVGNGLGGYGFNPRLKSWVRENAGRYDAVVLHGLWNYSSVGAWKGLRGGSTPFYIYPHGMMDPWFSQESPLKHIAKQVYWWLLEGRVLHEAQAVLFTSEEERLRARGVFRGHTYKERVVRYGSGGPPGEAGEELGAFYQDFPVLSEKPFLLFLGRIHPKKGCDILIHAFQRALKGSLPDLQLAVAGPDQVGWTQQLQSMAETLGVSHRIHWLGMLKGDRKWGALRAAQAMILPSHQENFGIAVAEAMACSTPVLISRAVNIWQEVEWSEGGFTAPDTEVGTIELIERFCSLDDEQRRSMGSAARAGFLKFFDVETASRDFMRTIGFR